MLFFFLSKQMTTRPHLLRLSAVCPRRQFWHQFYCLWKCFPWGTKYKDMVFCAIFILTTHSCLRKLSSLNDCIADVKNWVFKNFLKLISTKTGNWVPADVSAICWAFSGLHQAHCKEPQRRVR